MCILKTILLQYLTNKKYSDMIPLNKRVIKQFKDMCFNYNYEFLQQKEL